MNRQALETEGPSHGSDYLTVAEMATWIRVPEASILSALRSKVLPGMWFGSRVGWRATRDDFDKWIAAKKQEPMT